MRIVVKVACPSCGEVQTVPAKLTSVCPMCGLRIRAPVTAVRHREQECLGIFQELVVPVLLSVSYLVVAFVVAYTLLLGL